MPAEATGWLNGLRRRLRPEEVMLILYTVAMLVMMIVFRRVVRLGFHTVFGFSIMAIIAAWLIWRVDKAGQRAARFLRDFIPFIGCVLVYENLHEFLRDLPLTDRTQWALQMDVAIFGTLPCYWFERWICGPMNVLMLGCYSMHYVMAPVLSVVLYRARSEAVFRNFMLAVVGVLYVGYIGYVLVPVSPPLVLQKLSLAEQLNANSAAVRAVLEAYTNGPLRTPCDCFPSLHTGVTVVVLVSAWRHARRWFWVVLPFGSGLILATQYARIHFAIDLVAGAALAAVMIWAAPRVNAWWFGDARYRKSSVSGSPEPAAVPR
ncbi:MAG: phosphatase PAP2 family protein [Verrucomicrobia bacterium]|nr:phosphatase PAP2 family protein [Verrucomicrobiota bacterium]